MITDFKKYKKTEDFKEKASAILKKYAKYLIDEYLKINPKGENGRLYINLNQFYEEGRIKDIIFKNSKIKSKIEILNNMKEIIIFSNINNINIDIDTFENFFLKEYSPDEYYTIKNAKKYNL